MWRLTLLLVPLAAAPSACGAGQGGDERALAQLQRDMFAAEVRRDAVFLERAWAPDYTQTSSLGQVENRAQRLADVRSGSTAFETIDVREARARIYGTAGVVTALLAVKGKIGGRALEGTVRCLTVFVRWDGRWQAIAAQYTRVSGP